MRDLFSQCTCVGTYVSATFRNVGLHSRACPRTHASHALGCLAMTMKNEEDSAIGPPQRACFAESSAERNRRLATLNKESNEVNVQ